MNISHTFSKSAVLGLSLLGISGGSAELAVSKVFGDHMVLQQGQPIRVWGTHDPGTTVIVGIEGHAASVMTKPDGTWRAELNPLKADGKPRVMQVVSGETTIKFEDVQIGEVWICSGQSNMEWPMTKSLNPKEEIAAADHPMIRLFNVPGHVKSATPGTDARGTWQVCAPETVPGFSAVGYYFGRALREELGVPVGLVGTNWGGTRIEPWTPPVGFKSVPSLKDYVASLESGKPKGGATQIYNGMVHALTPLSARGVIWYQGESNAGDGLRYEFLKEALVNGWRSVFENDDLSFYWVQLADFRAPDPNPAGGGWGPVREGQRRALRIPNTGMATIIDIGNAKDIHPKNKQDVGKRLALWALAKDYGKDLVYSGPLYKGMKKEGKKIRIMFDSVGSGLMTGEKTGLEPTKEVTGVALTQFAIQDADGEWHWARAEIDGETVVVWHDEVKDPRNVRFGYQSNPDTINLYNKEGLPASPFTTD